MYDGGGVGENDRSVRGSGVGCDCSYTERTDPVLDSVSDLFSKAEEISVDDSRPSSCPAYTVYQLLAYCPNGIVHDLVLRKTVYSR